MRLFSTWISFYSNHYYGKETRQQIAVVLTDLCYKTWIVICFSLPQRAMERPARPHFYALLPSTQFCLMYKGVTWDCETPKLEPNFLHFLNHHKNSLKHATFRPCQTPCCFVLNCSYCAHRQQIGIPYRALRNYILIFLLP